MQSNKTCFYYVQQLIICVLIFYMCSFFICRTPQIQEYTQLPFYSVNRMVLRHDDVVEQGGYQKQEPLNCEFV